jgi:hypothetical protein
LFITILVVSVGLALYMQWLGLKRQYVIEGLGAHDAGGVLFNIDVNHIVTDELGTRKKTQIEMKNTNAQTVIIRIPRQDINILTPGSRTVSRAPIPDALVDHPVVLTRGEIISHDFLIIGSADGPGPAVVQLAVEVDDYLYSLTLELEEKKP